MKIVVANEVVMAVEKYVSYMKNDVGYSYDNLIENKDKMLTFLRGFIDKTIVANDNKTPKRYSCYWKDGKSPMAWIFTFIILPQQDLAVIYNLNYKQNMKENKEIKNILSLMKRMGMGINSDKSGPRRLNEIFGETDVFETINGFDVLLGYDLVHTCDSLKSFGEYTHTFLFSSDEITYALFQRCDNGKYFYVTIQDAPELGENETKWVAIPYKSVPLFIRKEATRLLQNAKK